MADRYLLESGSPDGYLLEDGTGVLLLNNSIAWERDTSSLDFSIDDTGLIATHVITGTDGLVRANTGHTTGDYSYTVVTGGTAGTSLVGLANASEITTNFCGGSANSIGWFFSDGDVYRGGSIILSPATVWVDGDTLTVRIKNGNLYLAKNGTYIGTMNPVAETGGVDVSTMGTLYPAVSVNAGKTLTADFTNWVTAAGTTVALTGQALTSAIGSLLVSTTLAITGQALTVGQGSVGIGAALSGQSLSVARGSVTGSTSAPLSGQSATAARGTILAATSVALSGLALTAAQGTLSPSPSLSLTGQSSSAAQGSVTQSRSIALSGLGTTLARGSVSPAISLTISGQSLVVAQGTVSVAAAGNVTLALTGQSLSVAQGSITGSVAATLTGQSASVSRGSIAPSLSLTLTGQSLTSSQGSIVGQIVLPTPPFTPPTISLGFRRQRPTNTAWGNGDQSGAVWKPDTDATNDWSNSGGQSGANWKKKS